MNTRRLLKNPSVIAGGGAIEMELSAHLREHSRTIYGKQQLLIGAYAKALEVIPRQVSSNAGMDPTDVLNKLFAIPGRPAALVRRLGLAGVHRLPPLKRFFMAEARGASGDLPSLLRGDLP